MTIAMADDGESRGFNGRRLCVLVEKLAVRKMDNRDAKWFILRVAGEDLMKFDAETSDNCTILW